MDFSLRWNDWKDGEKRMRVVCISIPISESADFNEAHIVPIGEWKERGFSLSNIDCEQIARNNKSFGIDLVIDYEHQSLLCMHNGQPAPAAGWIKDIEVRANGNWAIPIEWTEKAKAALKAKEYKYFSPVILFDDHDPHSDEYIGTSLHSVALTNTPYFRGDLEPMINSIIAKTQNQANKKEVSMTDAERIAALEKEKADLIAKHATDMQALKQSNEAQKAEMDTMKGTQKESEAVRMVDDAIAAKKLLPAQKEVGLIMARQGKENFDKLIASNNIPDLGKPVSIPGSHQDDGKTEKSLKEKYQALMNNPADMQKCKTDTPDLYTQMRNAFYGGE